MPENKVWEFNKGEWTEAYVFLRLLGDGRIYGANENLTKDESIYIDIVNIFRFEADKIYRFARDISESVASVYGYENDQRFIVLTSPELSEKAAALYSAIKTVKSGDRKFSVPSLQEYLQNLKFSSPKVPALPKKFEKKYGKKTDIVIEIEDSIDGARSEEGFSIKSHIGSNPTLFNSSTKSNIIYEVVGCNDDLMHRVNAVDDFTGKNATKQSPEKDGMIRAMRRFNLELKLAEDKCDEIFRSNIMYVDSRMLSILDVVVRLQTGIIPGAKSLNSEDIVEALAKINPLGFPNPKLFYEAKIKDFHFDSFSGMTASIEWDGKKRLTGGYIDVDKEGGLLYYRAISDDVFCSYLHKHLYFDRPDRGRYKNLAVAEAKAYLEGKVLSEDERNKIFRSCDTKGKWGYIYKEGNKYYMAINFQTRFR